MRTAIFSISVSIGDNLRLKPNIQNGLSIGRKKKSPLPLSVHVSSMVAAFASIFDLEATFSSRKHA